MYRGLIGVEYKEVSLEQRSSTVYRGVLFILMGVGLEEFHCIQRCPFYSYGGRIRGVPLYTEVSFLFLWG